MYLLVVKKDEKGKEKIINKLDETMAKSQLLNALWLKAFNSKSVKLKRREETISMCNVQINYNNDLQGVYYIVVGVYLESGGYINTREF